MFDYLTVAAVRPCCFQPCCRVGVRHDAGALTFPDRSRCAQRRRARARQIIDGLHTVVHVLQPIHQLAAGHEPFIENNGERLHESGQVGLAHQEPVTFARRATAFVKGPHD